MDIDETGFSGSQLYHNLGQVYTGCAFRYIAQTGSTNSLLKEEIQQGRLDCRTLMYTDWQSHGRGTRGRAWHQPAEELQRLGLDLALSAAAPQSSPRLAHPQFSLLVGGLVAVLVERMQYLHGMRAGEALPPLWSLAAVKWPNDLLVLTASGWRKAGGVLIETTVDPDGLRWVVIGLGLNVNSVASQFPPELTDQVATLREWRAHQTGLPLSEAFLERDLLLCHCAADLARFIVGEGLSDADLLQAWHARNRTAGTRYTFTRAAEQWQVSAVDVDHATGGLWVANAAGRRWLVASYTELSPPQHPGGGAL